MNYKNIFKRYEIKYLITIEQEQMLKLLMKEYMNPDKFSKSTINNIYFDTPNNLLIRRSREKPTYKEKLRIRKYGTCTSENTVFVELKKKFDGVVYKRRIDMDEKTAMMYLSQKTTLAKNSQISREIDYFLKYYKDIEPSIYLSYEREAFLGKQDESFRITFDKNILFRDYDLSFKKGVYGNSILPKEMTLLEVKTSLGIPNWLTQFLSAEKIYKRSFSKCGIAYQMIMMSKKTGGNIYVA